MEKNKEELFLNILQGRSENQRVEIRNKKEVRRKIKIKSLDLDALLVDFLSEALYLGQVHKEIYFNAKFTKFTDIEVEGELVGQRVESFGLDIRYSPKKRWNLGGNGVV